MLDNQADFGITQLPGEEKRLQVVKIHSDEIKALMPAAHPLARKQQILPQRSGRLSAADAQDRHHAPPPFRAGSSPWKTTLTYSMELDSTEMIKRFVLAGLGTSFLAGTLCRDEVAAGTLAAISLGPDPMVRQIALIYRKDKALSKAALGFIEVTLKNAAVDSMVRLPAKAAGPMERVAKTLPAEN